MKIKFLFAFVLIICSIQQLRADIWWQELKNKKIPNGTLPFAETASGEDLYIARAVIDGGIHIGKYQEGWSHASIPYNGEERWVSKFEIFTGQGYMVESSIGSIHPDAAVAGSEANGTALFVATAKVNGEWCIGKASSERGAFFPWGGKEHHVKQDFSVLVIYEYFRLKNKRNGRYLALEATSSQFAITTTSDVNAAGTLWRQFGTNQLQGFGEYQFLSIAANDNSAIVSSTYSDGDFGYVKDGAFQIKEPNTGAWIISRVKNTLKLKNLASNGYLGVTNDNNTTHVTSSFSLAGSTEWELESVNLLSARGHILIIDLPGIYNLCPTNKTNGDKDFSGNPTVDWGVELVIEDDGRRVDALVSFRAYEGKPDFSTLDHTANTPSGDKRFRKTVFTEFPDHKMIGFKASNSIFKYGIRPYSGIWGYEILVCSEGPILNGMPPSNSIIKSFRFIGDTIADDISEDTDCKCDTKIVEIQFHKKLMLYLR